MVGLVRRFSKPVYQGKWLRRMVELAEKSATKPIGASEQLVQIQKVDRRLSPPRSPNSSRRTGMVPEHENSVADTASARAVC